MLPTQKIPARNPVSVINISGWYDAVLSTPDLTKAGAVFTAWDLNVGARLDLSLFPALL